MAYKLADIEYNIKRLDNNGKIELKYNVYDTRKLKTQLVAYRIQHNNASQIVAHELMSVLDKADEYKTKTTMHEKESMIDRLMNERILFDRKYEPKSGIELLRKDNTCIFIKPDGEVSLMQGTFFDTAMLPVEEKAFEMSFDEWERVRMEQKINEHRIPELMDLIGRLYK